MDKNTIKKYAVWARREFIFRITQKALQYGITEKEIQAADVSSVNGVVLSAKEKKQRQALIAKINAENFEQVIEEVAYTWFNRFSALRYMEVNGFLPTHVRVFTDEENNFKPQILAEAIYLEIDGLDMEKVYALKDADDHDALFKYLIITQCNALSAILPGMFQMLDDYTELLFPDNLLREGSAIERMIAMIPEEDWRDAVEIIGWLYQYYNAEKKDDVFAVLKKNVKIRKENIPAATQLFTPDWIVRYMVENSLGRLWLEGHPNDELKFKWKYYLEEAEQESDVQAQLVEIRKEYEGLRPEDISCIDPCCGSGHILVYLFDVLVQIYEAYGYTAREAASSIVENNLYGLDIDDRAAQLASFAVMMKARQYDRRFFSRGIQPHVYAIVESNHVDAYHVDYFANGDSGLRKAITTIIDELHDAKEYGSVLTVTSQDWSEIYTRFDEIREDINILRDVTLKELLPIVDTAYVMSCKYHVAVTNPPYLSARGSMNPILTKYLTKYYQESKNDLFTVFMDVCNNMLVSNGLYSMINQQSWMFLAGFAKLREKIYTSVTIESLLHIGAGAFDGIAGEVVQSVAFVIRNSYCPDFKAKYIDFTNMLWKNYLKGFSQISHSYNMSIKEIRDIPNGILCYHLGGAAISRYYNGKRLDTFADPRVGMATGENDLFVRLWQEVSFDTIGFNYPDGQSTVGRSERWYPYNKGGECRRWYGNRTHLVDWHNNGENIKAFKQGRLLRGEIEKKNSECWNREYYFMESISWSKVSSGRFAVRYYEPGFIFDVAGCSILGLGNNIYYVMGALNSELRNVYIESLSPTLNFETGAIKAFPVIEDKKNKAEIEGLVKDCIRLEKEDWDAFESSWEYKRHPLVRNVEKISEAYELWQDECAERFSRLKSNEEELNRIFIRIYGLEEELVPKVREEDITLRKPELVREIKGLISYAVGCMFGRYSLDTQGIAYAGGVWDDNKYKTFQADKDNIIPICNDGDYLEDDVVGRFVEFIKVIYGEKYLEDNLKFIANALGGKSQPKNVIRNYFLNDYYADHCAAYSVTGSGKRPIYWLFDSGKKNGFKCLIYMHRYQPDTIARIRTDYVHEQQGRCRSAVADLEKRMEGASSGDRVKLSRQLATLQTQAAEIHDYEEKIHHLADQYVSLNLDDGVKVNYAKFQDVLAKIK